MNYIKLLILGFLVLCLIACNNEANNPPNGINTEGPATRRSASSNQFTEEDKWILLAQAEYMVDKENLLLNESRELLLSVLSRYPMPIQGNTESFDVDKLLEVDLKMQSLIKQVKLGRFQDRIALQTAFDAIKEQMQASILTGTKEIPQLVIDIELYKNMHPVF
ncbi:MAG: hypothetical protein MK212_13035, partial [Saprospiraceae bacterium]|nr:hypothetical protein [Saprospiraceae bacterium]